jgi:flagellum-specific peptidoglycan hydrolase FlgJ
MSGGSVGSSVRGAISDRMQASVMGLKEKFDPLNIASKLTGGSRIGPAMLGRMTGRSKEDIDYFANRKRIHRFDNVMNKGEGSGDSRKSIEALENIYSFMVKTRESQIKDNHSTFKFEDERQKANQRRHDEVMDVFNEATKRNRQAVKVIAKPKAVEKPPEAPPAAPPVPPKPGVSPKPEPARPAPPSAPAPAPAKPTVKPTEPVKAPPEVAKPPAKPVEPVKPPEVTKPRPEVVKPSTKPVETAKPITKPEPAPPSAAPAPPSVTKPPTAAPVKPAITETAKTAVKVAAAVSATGAFTSPDAFAKTMLPEAERASKEFGGVPPMALLGQWALESGWGKSVSGDFNYFGIKATPNWKGDKKLVTTRETFTDAQAKSWAAGMPGREIISKEGNKYLVKDWFRSYKSIKDAVDDKINFLKQDKRYSKVFNAKTTLEYFTALKKAGYATDENYIKIGVSMAESAEKKIKKISKVNNENSLDNLSTQNADMKKSLNVSSNAQPVVINNTTNVSNRETTVMPGSDKGSENPHYGRK